MFLLRSKPNGHFNRPSFFFSLLAEVSKKHERNAADPIVMIHEVATLVHLIESSKRAARAQGIRSVVLLEVPRLLEGRPYIVSVAINNLWHDNAFQAKKTAGGFVLISPISVSRLAN